MDTRDLSDILIYTHYPSGHTVPEDLPYSGKVWQAECLANLLFSSIWWKKVWQMNRSAKGLSMVTTNLDGFSLANRRRFAKFTELSPRQTFLLYGSVYAQQILV